MKSVKHVNPYRKGSSYWKGFEALRVNKIVTRSQLVDFLMKEGVVSSGNGKSGNEAAIATATVLLSPREKDGRGSKLGNLSAKGECYFVQPLKKAAGEERRFRLRWRSKMLAKRDYIRPSTLAIRKIPQEKDVVGKTDKAKAPAIA